MKVLYTTTVPAPYKVDMFEELGKQCDLTVVFEKRKLSYRNEGWMRANFQNFKAIFLKGISIKDRIISLKLISLIRNGRFDAIIIGAYSTPSAMIAIEYMRAKKIPYILSSDGGLIKKDSTLGSILKKRYIGSASAWMSTGTVTTDYLCHYGADKKGIHIYPFSSVKEADVQRSEIGKNEKEEIRNMLCIKEKYCIVSVGQFIHRKGFDLLLTASKDIPKNVGIYIIGGEPTEEYLAMKKKYGLTNVYFVGFKAKDELAEYYKAADLFVLPTREDIWGLVINEAMAYGLPVITTDKCVAGLEMVENGVTGYIIQTDDAKALAATINQAIIGGLLQEEQCRRTALEYTIESMAKEHWRILCELEDK